MVTVQNLHAMAIRGARAYKKSLVFSTHKWDHVTMAHKKSRETMEDVVEYVRRMMYHDNKKSRKPSESSECESDSENIRVSSNPPPCSNGTTNIPPTKESTPSSTSSIGTMTKKDANIDTINSDAESDGSGYSADDDADVPVDYLFPYFIVFVLHGPFVPPSEKLNINIIDNDKKKGEGSGINMGKNC